MYSARRLLLFTSLLFLLFLMSVRFCYARSGCCSHHGGVCGCGCCDGTPLSNTCRPYYSECGGPVKTVIPTPRPTLKPIIVTPKPLPTMEVIKVESPAVLGIGVSSSPSPFIVSTPTPISTVKPDKTNNLFAGLMGSVVFLGLPVYVIYKFVKKFKK
jgi:hypothetical protein